MTSYGPSNRGSNASPLAPILRITLLPLPILDSSLSWLYLVLTFYRCLSKFPFAIHSNSSFFLCNMLRNSPWVHLIASHVSTPCIRRRSRQPTIRESAWSYLRRRISIWLTFGCHWGFSIYSVDPTLLWLPYPKPHNHIEAI